MSVLQLFDQPDLPQSDNFQRYSSQDAAAARAHARNRWPDVFGSRSDCKRLAASRHLVQYDAGYNAPSQAHKLVETLHHLAVPFLYRKIGKYHFLRKSFAETITSKPHYASLVQYVRWDVRATVYATTRDRTDYGSFSPVEQELRQARDVKVLSCLTEMKSLWISFYVDASQDSPRVNSHPRFMLDDGAINFLPTPEQMATIPISKLVSVTCNHNLPLDSMWLFNRGHTIEGFWPSFVVLLRAKSIQSLNLMNMSFAGCPSEVEDWSSIRRLSITNPSPFGGGQMTRLVRRCSNMVDLHFDYDSNDGDIQHFALVMMGGCPAQQNLTRLSLVSVGPYVGQIAPFGTLFPSVRTLQLVMTDGGLDVMFGRLFPECSGCPALKRFHLSSEEHYGKLVDEDIFPEPEGIYTPLQYLFCTFLDEGSFPSLTKVEFTCGLGRLSELEERYNFVQPEREPTNQDSEEETDDVGDEDDYEKRHEAVYAEIGGDFQDLVAAGHSRLDLSFRCLPDRSFDGNQLKGIRLLEGKEVVIDWRDEKDLACGYLLEEESW